MYLQVDAKLLAWKASRAVREMSPKWVLYSRATLSSDPTTPSIAIPQRLVRFSWPNNSCGILKRHCEELSLCLQPLRSNFTTSMACLEMLSHSGQQTWGTAFLSLRSEPCQWLSVQITGNCRVPTDTHRIDLQKILLLLATAFHFDVVG